MLKKTRNYIIAAAAVLVVCIAGGSYYVYDMLHSSYQGEKIRLYIPAGATNEDVRDSLTTRLGDFGETVYTLWHARKSSPSKAHGSYVVESGATALDVSRILRSGRQTPVKVAFNNIRTLDALAERVAARMEWDANAFLGACDSILPAKGFKETEYLAAFLPDTYEFYWTTPAKDVVKKLSDIRDRYWSDDRRARAAIMGLSPVKVATLASIVEEETAKADEQGKVARLYLNRLNKGMLLQADPTVKYAVGDFGLRRILNRHLSVDSPYNTYKYEGLPPGPIRMPEKRTLEAVLNAPEHNYLYMCAKEDFSGYHNFAADYATHLNNARRYQQELNRRGIK